MKQYLLPEKGIFYKANMHTHTTISDGQLTPEEIKEIYKARGYFADELTAAARGLAE
ncbi:MAG: hypothetical protein J6R04_01195 [Clostridia bacterium]|nr:hypothetical protein [Clostridia bacterium]